MKHIFFRVPFKLITERNWGNLTNAIVTFENRVWQYQSRTLSEEERNEKGYAIEVVNVQYKRILFIDLWLFTLRFEWLSKDKSTPNPSL